MQWVSRAAAIHGARLEHAYAGGNGHRQFPGFALTRRTLPYDAAARPMDAHQGWLLSRWPLPDAGRRDQPLQLAFLVRLEFRREKRPGRIPEVALSHSMDAGPLRARAGVDLRRSCLGG